MTRRNIVICDLDGTLSDSSHREHLIDSEGWDAFHAAGKDDPPIMEMADLVDALSTHFKVIIVTGRNEKHRKMTVEWLHLHSIRVDGLLMRPDNDFSKSGIMKRMLIEREFGPHWSKNVAMVIDDHEGVVAEFAPEGITVLQVHSRTGASNG